MKKERDNISFDVNKDFLQKRKKLLFFRVFAFVFAGFAAQGIVFFLSFLDDIFRFMISLLFWAIFYWFLVVVYSRFA